MKIHSQAGLTMTDSFLINEIASLLAFPFSFPNRILGARIHGGQCAPYISSDLRRLHDKNSFRFPVFGFRLI